MERTYFRWQLLELRVIGGRILDVVDPSRASVDPAQKTFFCEPKPTIPPVPVRYFRPRREPEASKAEKSFKRALRRSMKILDKILEI